MHQSSADENMALEDKMELWMKHDSDSDITDAWREIFEASDTLPETSGGSYPEHSQSEADEALSAAMPGLQKYRECIVKSAAYEWLLNDLQRHCFLASSGPDVMAEIGKAITHGLPTPSRFSRRESALPFIMTYAMEWDLVHFLKDQEYIETNSQALPMKSSSGTHMLPIFAPNMAIVWRNDCQAASIIVKT
ncbi:hypothetical protein N7452_007790 [Penicillium brevicompactum]|uniref:Uncharacterized protein n=1 Tax=Penicillium brevicompactum TaxID=5074 RepID=A0A9W9QHD2_PENBR|nr:hypothetical protein N7452_007790 [Penicillium brevicompactum]